MVNKVEAARGFGASSFSWNLYLGPGGGKYEQLQLSARKLKTIFIFQNDNDPINKKMTSPEVLEWPSHSPDLNLMPTLEGDLKTAVIWMLWQKESSNIT